MKKIITIFLVFLTVNISSVYAGDYHSTLKQKADAGDAISQNDLGHLYLNGFPDYSIPQDIEKAIHYLNEAAAQNQVNAMTTVGWVHFSGEYGAIKDNEQAVGWNKKASDLGCSTASYNMGFFYYGGWEGLNKDLI